MRVDGPNYRVGDFFQVFNFVYRNESSHLSLGSMNETRSSETKELDDLLPLYQD